MSDWHMSGVTQTKRAVEGVVDKSPTSPAPLVPCSILARFSPGNFNLQFFCPTKGTHWHPCNWLLLSMLIGSPHLMV